MDIHVDPPRHFPGSLSLNETGDICYRAIVKGDCPLQHSYANEPITRDEDAQLEWIRAQIDGSYPGTDYHGPANDHEALAEVRRMADCAANALLNRDGQAALGADVLASAAHGRAVGYALVARDLLLTFINRATQQGVLDPFTKLAPATDPDHHAERYSQEQQS